MTALNTYGTIFAVIVMYLDLYLHIHSFASKDMNEFDSRS